MLRQQFHAPMFQRCLPAWVSKKDVLADVFMCLQADRAAMLIFWVALPLLTFSSSTLPPWAPTSHVVQEWKGCCAQRGWEKGPALISQIKVAT